MDEELDIDLEGQEEKINRPEQRVKKLLSDKENLAKEKEAERLAREKAENEKQAALKEVEFYKGFTAVAAKYGNANEYQEKIREKVLSGYDVEDATISILAKEGKYTAPAAPPPPRENPAGGSANNQIKVENKSVGDMTQAERLAALREAEIRGDISV